ncbi:MAG: hypothetical protein LBJ67_17865 [Planctomycetaceae bacterium]|jgi:hypothetical protein|nr:hypothetical protein [Planctomycetaceae bacterium]
MSSLTGYPKDFTIAALIYQVSFNSQQSPQTCPYVLDHGGLLSTQWNET